MDDDHAKLDIILHWLKVPDAFEVTLLYDDPNDEWDRVDIADSPITFDLDQLGDLTDDADGYGTALSAMLFERSELRDLFSRALSPDRTMTVHVRLLIAGAPAQYQAIRWETLREPGAGGVALAKHEGVRFSRFLEGPGWADAGSLARGGHLKALVVVADPSDAEDYGSLDQVNGPRLARVDVDDEVTRAVAMLNGMQVKVLARGHGDPPTLDNVIAELRKGQNVLFLLCHGLLSDTGATLLLETSDGDTDAVHGGFFADRIGSLKDRPTIAVLSSCASAGPGDEYLPSDKGPLSPIGPLLARAGVSIVVGMQGNVTMTSARDFMASFFHELDRDGRADRAMAIARGKISGRKDWWMPVLFSRLKHPRVWYKPGFGGGATRIFEDLWERIKDGSCTPIVGSGVAGAGLLPDRHLLAEEWVERRQLPLSGPSRRDLATVAQYMKVDSGADLPRVHLRQHLRRALEAGHRSYLPDLDWESRPPLEALITAIGRGRRELLGKDDPRVTNDLHAVLVSMRLPVYITTSWTNLLEDALVDAGRNPQVRFFDWRQTRKQDMADDALIVSPQYPLVYHLFGTIDGGKSMVLTEDDYFGWLRAWNKRVDNDPMIPDAVKVAFTLPSLMFVGYQLHDWEFRILFQGIKSFAANENMRERQHIGVQLPVDAGAIDRDVSQEYLNSYFKDDDLDIYWGSVRDFLLELRDAESR